MTRQGKRLFNCTVGCPNYQPDYPANPEKGGKCRFNPPTPVVLGMQQQTNQLIVQGIWPVVTPTDWCSKHPHEVTRIAMGLAAPSEFVPPILRGKVNGGDVEPVPMVEEPVTIAAADEVPLPGEQPIRKAKHKGDA